MSIKFYLRDDRIRRNLIDYINSQSVNADFPLVVSFSDPKRTLPQNSLFHAICSDLANTRVQWAGSSGPYHRGRQFWCPVTLLQPVDRER